MSCLALRIPQYVWLHLPKPGFFQCFPTVPKSHLTLWKCVVSAWAINLSMVWKWRGRSWGKSTSNCVEKYGYNNLYLSRFVARVFSLKYSLTFIGNVGIYSVGIESVYQIAQFGKTECFASVSREGLPASYLRTTAVSIYPDSSHSSHMQGTCIISRDA